MLKNIWHQSFLVLLIFLIGVVLGAYVPEVRESIRSSHGIILLKYATWFVGLSTIIYWFWQTNLAKTKTEVEMALKMAEKFDSTAMTHHRVQASKSLLANSTESNPSVDAILNFFEEIEFLLDKRVVSDDVAWNFFSYWVLYFCLATKAYRESAEKEGADILGFGGIENLFKRMLRVEKEQARKNGTLFREVEREDIIEFLEDESMLEGKPESFREKLKKRTALLNNPLS